MPHIVGGAFRQHLAEATRLSVIAKHTELMVMFGGFAMRNTQICDGGNSKHRIPAAMDDCVKNGVKFINISPLRSDADPHLKAEWLAPKPGSDTAVMMGLAHSLLSENLHDTAFLNRYTVGFDKFAAYLRGESDGQEKSADWAAEISGLDAERIRELAREMAEKRTMVTCAAGLQRADWGEQPLWDDCHTGGHAGPNRSAGRRLHDRLRCKRPCWHHHPPVWLGQFHPTRQPRASGHSRRDDCRSPPQSKRHVPI